MCVCACRQPFKALVDASKAQEKSPSIGLTVFHLAWQSVSIFHPRSVHIKPGSHIQSSLYLRMRTLCPHLKHSFGFSLFNVQLRVLHASQTDSIQVLMNLPFQRTSLFTSLFCIMTYLCWMILFGCDRNNGPRTWLVAKSVKYKACYLIAHASCAKNYKALNRSLLNMHARLHHL